MPSHDKGRDRARGRSRFGLIGDIVRAFSAKYVSLLASGVAFYGMLSIFPALAVLISIYGLVANPEIVENQIEASRAVLPAQASELLAEQLQSLVHNAHAKLGIGLAVSVVLMLWSSRAAASSVMTALNVMYGEAETRSFIVTQGLALILTASSILFGILALTAVAVIPVVVQFLPLGTGMLNALTLLRWPVLALFVGLGFGLMYRYAPCRGTRRRRHIAVGACVATLLWIAASGAFSLYVSSFSSYDRTYGSLGAVIILLMWFYVSAIAFLTGALVDAELGDRAQQKPPDEFPSGGLIATKAEPVS